MEIAEMLARFIMKQQPPLEPLSKTDRRALRAPDISVVPDPPYDNPWFDNYWEWRDYQSEKMPLEQYEMLPRTWNPTTDDDWGYST